MFAKLLRQYAKSHTRTRDDGTVVPWIDEVRHPLRDEWSCRKLLEDMGWLEWAGGRERGKDYNHSLFCDLVLSGLFGISVKDGRLTADPMVPDTWDSFKVENLWLHGKRYRVLYKDKKTTVEEY